MRPDAKRPVPAEPPVAQTPGTTFGVSVDEENACAWNSGRAWCWGRNGAGQLGVKATDTVPSNRDDAPSNPCNFLPARLPTVGVAKVVATGGSTCTLDIHGQVRCWGDAGKQNEHGDAPYLVPQLRVKDMAAAGSVRCFVTTTGEVWCQGAIDPRRGDIPNQSHETSDLDPHGLHHVAGVGHAVAVALTNNMAYALRIDGVVLAWGIRDNGDYRTQEVPALRGAKEIRTDGAGACGLLLSGRIVCEPAATPPPPTRLKEVVTFSGGSEHGCAVLTNKSVHCWSNSRAPQDGDLFEMPLLKGAQALSTSIFNGCAVLASSVMCWGNNNWGQLGIGGQIGQRLGPTRVRLPWGSAVPPK